MSVIAKVTIISALMLCSSASRPASGNGAGGDSGGGLSLEELELEEQGSGEKAERENINICCLWKNVSWVAEGVPHTSWRIDAFDHRRGSDVGFAGCLMTGVADWSLETRKLQKQDCRTRFKKMKTFYSLLDETDKEELEGWKAAQAAAAKVQEGCEQELEKQYNRTVREADEKLKKATEEYEQDMANALEAKAKHEAEAEKAIEDAMEAKTNHEEDVGKVLKAKNDHEQELARVAQEKEAAEERLEQLRKEILAMEAKVASYKEQEAKINEELEKAKTKSAELAGKAPQLDQDLEEAKARKGQMNAKIGELEDSLAKSKTEHYSVIDGALSEYTQLKTVAVEEFDGSMARITAPLQAVEGRMADRKESAESAVDAVRPQNCPEDGKGCCCSVVQRQSEAQAVKVDDHFTDWANCIAPKPYARGAEHTVDKFPECQPWAQCSLCEALVCHQHKCPTKDDDEDDFSSSSEH